MAQASLSTGSRSDLLFAVCVSAVSLFVCEWALIKPKLWKIATEHTEGIDVALFFVRVFPCASVAVYFLLAIHLSLFTSSR
jgi:hypothetical protein